jgi:class I fructose-bisphosphate aldolase
LVRNAQLALDAGAAGLIFGRNMWQRPMDQALNVSHRVGEMMRKF